MERRVRRTFTRSQKTSAAQGFRGREGETRFINARKMGKLIDRTHRELSDADIAEVARTYHAWRGEDQGAYADIPGFCKTSTLKDIRAHYYVLTPGLYVG